MAKCNSKQQIQITHGKLQTLTAKTKTIIAIENSSRQEQNAHGKSKTLTAKAKQSQQKQNAHSKIKSRIVVSGCPSTWCRVSLGCFPLCQTDRSEIRRNFRVKWSDIFR